MKNPIITWAQHLQSQIIDHGLALNHPAPVSIRYVQLSMDSYSNQVDSAVQVGQLLGRDELRDFAVGYDVVMQNNKVYLKVFMKPGPDISLYSSPSSELRQIASLAQKVNASAVVLYVPMYK